MIYPKRINLWYGCLSKNSGTIGGDAATPKKGSRAEGKTPVRKRTKGKTPAVPPRAPIRPMRTNGKSLQIYLCVNMAD